MRLDSSDKHRRQWHPAELQRLREEISQCRRNAAAGCGETVACSAPSHLTDIVKGGMSERFDHLRAMGIRTMMITGDNPLTAAAIAREAGVDDFLARSQARRQDGADQARASQGQARGHDRRRHQRRSGARAGGCRRGHEHRNASRQRSRQHGRSRFQPDEAHRNCRDRQTTPDHPRRADHIFRCQ